MAKRLRDVCGLPESEPLCRAGRGFVVRDLPWTVEKLRVIPPFEFENWAVIALGGSHYAVLIGDTPCADEAGNIIVLDGEKEVARLKPLKSFEVE